MKYPFRRIFDKMIHCFLGKIDHRAGQHGLDLVIITLVERFDVAQLAGQGLGRKKIQFCGNRLGVQKDAPVQAVVLFANVDMVQPVPVSFHFPDKGFVRSELLGVAFGGRFAYLYCP